MGLVDHTLNRLGFFPQLLVEVGGLLPSLQGLFRLPLGELQSALGAKDLGQDAAALWGRGRLKQGAARGDRREPPPSVLISGEPGPGC